MSVGRALRIAAVVLAAGRSSRMGEPKQLLPVDGRASLELVLESLRAAGVDEVVLVLGFAAEEIRRQIAPESFEGVRVVVNPRFEEGMAGSLREGLSALRENADAALIVLADQPLVRSGTMDRTVEKFRAGGGGIVIPTYKGKRGNPVLLGREIFAEAMALTGDTGCRAIFAEHASRIVEVEVDDPGILQDMDTREDYERLRDGVRS